MDLMQPLSPERLAQVESVLAFDYGTQKMGMAIGQRLLDRARPLNLIPMKEGTPDWTRLLAMVQEWRPQLCLVGLPLNMDDSESELSRRARKFARRLQHQSQIPVRMIDERLTTRDAREALQHYQAQGQARRLQADSLAAALLIEQWWHDQTLLLP